MRDGDDTYLVVAADKGTATFSDTANRVSQRVRLLARRRVRARWLGGLRPQGARDHGQGRVGVGQAPLQGARGRHAVATSSRSSASATCAATCSATGCCCREQDPARRGVRPPAHLHRPVAGCGCRLRRAQAAVRDAAVDLGRLRRATLISEGGGVFPRTAKSIRLVRAGARGAGRRRTRRSRRPTSSARSCARRSTCCGTAASGRWSRRPTRATPTRTTAPPTRSASTRNELRAKVVGEGGNLGFTRRARDRVRGRAAGAINADFIDNSAGVDCSDHEVNLKILLGLAERAGELTREERDELLLDVTDDVVAHVLYDSFLPAQIIAQEVDRSAIRLFAYEDLMVQLEELGLLDRAAPRTCRPARRSASAAAPDAAWSGPSSRSLLAYSKRLLARALERVGLRRRAVARARPARLLPTRRGQALRRATCPSIRCAAADLHGQRERDRQRARPDVHVAADGRARRRAGRRRARVPDRPRSDRRGRALGGRRAARERHARTRSSS